MIVAVTGATGFAGGHLLDALGGHAVRALARRPQAPREGVTWIAGDLDDHAALARLCEGADAVIHVAGVVSADAATFDRANRLGTQHVLDAATRAGVPRLVHVSSLAAREPQLSVYGASKRAGEDLVTASDRDWRVVRPPAVYGPRDTEMLELFRMAKRGLVPLPPRGRFSIIHAADLAALLFALLTDRLGPAIYEPEDAHTGGYDHRDFARMLGTALGRRSVLAVNLPAPLVRIGAAIDERMRGPAAKLTRDRAAYMCHPAWVTDPARQPPPALWRPRIDTATGLAQTAHWYRQAGWL